MLDRIGAVRGTVRAHFEGGGRKVLVWAVPLWAWRHVLFFWDEEGAGLGRSWVGAGQELELELELEEGQHSTDSGGVPSVSWIGILIKYLGA